MQTTIFIHTSRLHFSLYDYLFSTVIPSEASNLSSSIAQKERGIRRGTYAAPTPCAREPGSCRAGLQAGTGAMAQNANLKVGATTPAKTNSLLSGNPSA
jgi:hypothetical protein